MKVGVVGGGFVGSAAAYALVHQGVGREIVLVDRNEARARAEADDIQHAVPFANPLEVSAGGYADLAGCRIVILLPASIKRPARPAWRCSAATPSLPRSGATGARMVLGGRRRRAGRGLRPRAWPRAGEDARAEIDRGVRHAAHAIIQGKGATYYGIGAALARIVEVVLSDQRSILRVCTPLPKIDGVHDVTVSLPHLVGGSGILARLPLGLTADEEQALARSARIVKDAIDALSR